MHFFLLFFNAVSENLQLYMWLAFCSIVHSCLGCRWPTGHWGDSNTARKDVKRDFRLVLKSGVSLLSKSHRDLEKGCLFLCLWPLPNGQEGGITLGGGWAGGGTWCPMTWGLDFRFDRFNLSDHIRELNRSHQIYVLLIHKPGAQSGPATQQSRLQRLFSWLRTLSWVWREGACCTQNQNGVSRSHVIFTKILSRDKGALVVCPSLIIYSFLYQSHTGGRQAGLQWFSMAAYSPITNLIRLLIPRGHDQ